MLVDENHYLEFLKKYGPTCLIISLILVTPAYLSNRLTVSASAETSQDSGIPTITSDLSQVASKLSEVASKLSEVASKINNTASNPSVSHEVRGTTSLESMLHPSFIEVSNGSKSPGNGIIKGQYIVSLRNTSSNITENQEAREDAVSSINNQGIFDVVYNYTNVLNGSGFAIKLKENVSTLEHHDAAVNFAIAGLARNIDGLSIEPDRKVFIAEQSVPTGVMRIGGVTAMNNTGNQSKDVNATIAVIDTGIDSNHPDLNVIGGKSFIPEHSSYQDDNGHGTHVAGIIGAKDDKIGVIGVAPGTKLIALKVLDASGSGDLSWIIAAVDYVTNMTSTSNGTKIDGVNLSLEFPGSSAKLQQAIADSVSKGVTYISAAGNDLDNAMNYSPARYGASAYNLTITVSSMTDSDGKCGGRGTETTYGGDDTFAASYSNYGPAVTLAAPGTEIFSTYKNSSYAFDTGTSMAAPHVTGAVALYKEKNPNASPQEVRNSLLNMATPSVNSSNPLSICDTAGSGYYDISADTDGIKEPLLYVGKMSTAAKK